MKRQSLQMGGAAITVVAAVVACDQLTKTWAMSRFSSVVTVNVWGAGSLPWLGTHPEVWLWGSGAVLVGLGFWAAQQLKKSPHQYQYHWLAWGLVLGGGLSNWLDRWQWQGVRDWLSFPGLALKNNLADYALTVGIIWLMVNWLRVKEATLE